MLEAWSWLEAQGLLIWSEFGNDPNGWRRLSRKGQQLQADGIPNFKISRQLSSEVLDESIRYRVWSDFVRGHYDSAVFFAAKHVEICVRDAAEYPPEKIGVSLMRDAFKPKTGPLSEKSAPMAEQEARSSLFAGFIGSYKNPGSHREIDLEDPAEPIEVILMANHLIRIVTQIE